MQARAGVVSLDRTGALLRGLDGATFRFDPGAICLAFALTGGEAERSVFETLHTPADLRRWMRLALGWGPSPIREGDLIEAKRLREAIWHCAEARALGLPLPSAQVGTINRAAAAPPPAPRIDAGGHAAWVVPVAPCQVWSALARDAVRLLTGELAGRVRQCEAPDCRLLFADASRPGRRRWCSMERCGNRAKVRAHRARRRDNPTTDGGDT